MKVWHLFEIETKCLYCHF